MANKQRFKKEEIAKRNKLKLEKPYVYEKIMKFDEKVKKGESIAILQFQYDYACNLRCHHCCITKLRRPKGERCFTPKDVAELSRQADEMGLAHIVITGGEPMVFPDFDQIVKAIDPQKFYITSDSNGFLLDEKRAKHLKKIGVDKVQISLDSLDPDEHDEFRRVKGAHARALRAIKASQDAGLNVIVQTVVTKQRLHSKEFMDFLKYLNKNDVPVFITFAKPVGDWEGNFDAMINKKDLKFVQRLEKSYDVFTHLTPSYGLNLGCIGVKRMVSVTKYGDIMPCPYMHTSLGNFFKEPLKDIIERGMDIKWFGKYVDTCLMAADKKFVKKYVAGRIYGKPLPVPYTEVFTREDMIKKKGPKKR